MPRSPEQVREAKRLHMARKRAADPEAVRVYQRNLHAKNRERNTEKIRLYYARRFFRGRAMKLRGEDRATTLDLGRMWKRQRGLCALTSEKLTRQNAELDHILPKARGGTDCASNLRWVTRTVNFAKRDLTDTEFIALCGNVMRWLGRRIELVNAEAAA